MGEIFPWSAFIGAMRTASTLQLASKGAGLRILTETVSSPTLAAQIEEILARFPAAMWHQWDPGSEMNEAAGLRMAAGSDVSVQYNVERAAVIVSLDADFLSCGPGHLRYARQFALRRRPEGGGCRLYAAESHAVDDGRESRSSPSIEAKPGRAARARTGRRRRRRRRQSRRATPGRRAGVARCRSRRSERASRVRHRRRRRGTASGRARACACDERSARQHGPDGSVHRFRRTAPCRSSSVDSRTGRRDGRRTGRHAHRHRRQPGIHRAGGSAVRRADEQGAGTRAPQLACERDVGGVALADSRGAFPRGVERRPRIRRHRVDRAAAHRAAVWRTVCA